MAGRASPWPPRLLMLILTLMASSLHLSHSTDVDVLLKFKESLAPNGGDAVLQNWVAGTTPCNVNVSLWTGVICDTGDVYGLQLEKMKLSGLLSIDILVDLPFLRTLSFMNNDFEGPMPKIEKLPALKSIYLSNNRFSGEIADGVFKKFRSMKKVHLSHNQFTGRIPTSLLGLTRLLELRLDDNKFEGPIPDLRQPGLYLVNMSYNNLEGPIPARLSKMKASMFEGNKNLCGPPLDISCGSSSSSSSPSSKLTPALLVIIIVIAIGVLLAIIGVIFFMLRGSRKQMEPGLVSPSITKKSDPSEADKLEQGSVESSGGAKKVAKEEHGKLMFVKEGAQRFELQDLLKASAEVLGSGNFGSSYKAILFDGPAVVVKRFNKMNGVGREDFQEHMRRLGRLSHPSLLPLVAYYYRKEEKLLVTDYIPNGSLAHMLHGRGGSNIPPLDWPTRLKIVKGVARGLAFLYEELPMLTVPHGHLKSSNVLLDDSYEPILTDYALVPVMNQTHASQIMVAYKSPECAERGRPSRKSDVWSFGILILEILTGKFPANYLRQGRAGTDLASWVNSVVKEEWTGEVFDNEMGGTKNGEGEMLKLLQIGLGCCEMDVEKRWDLRMAVDKIEELREKENDEEDSSFATEGEANTSKAMTEDELLLSTNN
ncbi:pollen receptor-like kinase 1 [Elaeis guineensis]|uniref:non-specific serine/threonine protein kinase n=1 Tax=Elaeis guineensis var. tenera TaxID=51953 RepID=A0A6I9QV51_ELAGV|nr:pollen receptor-like kinase 1 [Elaeis guineensis]